MTTYDEALATARRVGVSHASDAALMATICESTIQTLCGAVSPKLVWEGAQAAGMTTKALVELANTDPAAVADLMWQ